eukprot:5800191-Pleurochrysis_carterae.AAC.1
MPQGRGRRCVWPRARSRCDDRLRVRSWARASAQWALLQTPAPPLPWRDCVRHRTCGRARHWGHEAQVAPPRSASRIHVCP